jgi:hypothetical protein
VVAAIVVALVGVAPAEPAFAKKNKIIGTVNGRKLKAKGRRALVTYSDNGTIILASKGRRFLRTLGFGCAINPLRQATFPLTPPPEVCTGNYTETRVRGANVTIDGWLKTTGVNVTFDTFDGRRLTGSFSGVLDAVPPNGALPAAIEGTFSVEPQE